MRRIQPLRREIGQRTIFNLMGPLSNPAYVERQLIGIARPAYVPIYAEARAELGAKMALIVSGDEGLDELSLAGGNEVAMVEGREFVMQRLSCTEIGLEHAPVEAIRGGDPAFNAGKLKELLDGEKNAYRDAAVFNAAASLKVAGRGSDWTERRALAEEAIDSGAAKRLLESWIELAR